MTFQHGITVYEVANASRTIATIATGVIGLVATATAAAGAPTAALNAAFPLNKPVLVQNINAAIDAAGTGGTLAGALQAIADQVRPTVVVVRVAAGADAASTNAAVIGGTVNGVRTGMQALLAAETQLGVRPRILGAPERSILRQRIMAGLARSTKRSGRPPLDAEKVERIKRSLAKGVSINATAQKLRVGVGTVHRLKQQMAQTA